MLSLNAQSMNTTQSCQEILGVLETKAVEEVANMEGDSFYELSIGLLIFHSKLLVVLTLFTLGNKI